MIWDRADDGFVCRVPRLGIAVVYPVGVHWFAEITTEDDGYCFWNSDALPTEAAAKAGVDRWMAELEGCIFATRMAGFVQPDDGN